MVKSFCIADLPSHNGHVGGQEQKYFSPLGTKLFSHHCKFFEKNSIVLTLNMAAFLHGCKPRIVDFSNQLDLQYILDGRVLLYTIPLFTTLTGYIIIFHTFDIPTSKMRWLLVDARYIAYADTLIKVWPCKRTFKNSLKQVFKS